jgi:hypothetical protein
MPGPDPAGEKPDDWPTNHWLAFVALSGGATRRVAALQCGVSVGTIDNWLVKWRERYDPDLLRWTGKKITPEISALGAQAASIVHAKKWADIRGVMARRYGALSDKSLEVVLQGLDGYLRNPNKLKTLTVTELLALAKISDMAAQRADKLDDTVDATRAHLAALGVASGPTGPDEGLLAGLELSGDDMTDTLAGIEIVSARFFHLIEGGEPVDDDTIDVQEVAG